MSRLLTLTSTKGYILDFFFNILTVEKYSRNEKFQNSLKNDDVVAT